MNHWKTVLGLVGTLVLLTSVALALLPGLSGATDVEAWLTILHNNDGESELLPDTDGSGGIGNFVARVNQLRSAVAGDELVLTLSSGDNFLAGPLFNAGLDNGIPFYDTMALDMTRYDAICLGNHDFDFGPNVLADFMAGFSGFDDPIYLSSNLDFSLEPGLQAYVTSGKLATNAIFVDVHDNVYGVIGATTENLRFISSPRNVVVNAVATAVQNEIDSLAQGGITRIILISHLQSILEDQALAGMVDGIDVMIAGGGDELLANAGDLLSPGDTATDIFGPYPLWVQDGMLRDIPVVTTSGQYRYVGQLRVGFDANGEVVMVDESVSGPVRVVDSTYPDGVSPDAAAVAQIEDPLALAVAAQAADIIAQSQVDLDGRRAMVRTSETNQGNLIADALRWEAARQASEFGLPEPQVALQNGGGIRNDEIVPAGPISALKVFQMVPFANFVCIVPDVPRTQFKEILENALSRVEFTDGRFAQISGFRVRWDPAGTAQVLDAAGNILVPGSRVVDVVLDDFSAIVVGGMVVPGPDLTVATIDFLANGGDQYPYRGAAFTRVGATYQQALQSYLEIGQGGVIAAGDYQEGGEGRITTDDIVAIDDRHLDDPDTDQDVVTALTLGRNYPNPFNPTTTISFALPGDQHVRLAVYDVKGKLIRSLVDDSRGQGPHTVVWNGQDDAGRSVPSGTYYYRLETSSRVESRTMVLLK